eukprot:106505_1
MNSKRLFQSVTLLIAVFISGVFYYTCKNIALFGIDVDLRHNVSNVNNSKFSNTSMIVWCVKAIYGNISLSSLKLWETHYKTLGVSAVFVYRIPTTPNYVIKYLSNDSFYHIRNISNNALNAINTTWMNDFWIAHYTLLFAINDCFQEVQQYKFHWVGFGDFDEYIWWNTTDKTITEWLTNNYNNNDCITMGKRFHSMKTIFKSRADANLTKHDLYHMPFTPSLPYCYHSPESKHQITAEQHYKCDDWHGRRKYIINLRKIDNKSKDIITLTNHQCIGFKNKKILHVDKEGCFHEWRNYLNFNENTSVVDEITDLNISLLNSTAKYHGIPWLFDSHLTKQFPLLQKDDLFLNFVQKRYAIN